MADENTNVANGEASAAEAPQVKLQILSQFIRDLSFENIVVQKGLPSGEVKPEFSVQVSLDARKRPTPNQYEVVCKFKVASNNSTGEKQPLFLCELDYSGIFNIEGVPEDQLFPFLMIECPRMLFPFVRRIVADVTRDGGFPSFMMEPVDFVALYRQEIARRAQAAEQAVPDGQKLS